MLYWCVSVKNMLAYIFFIFLKELNRKSVMVEEAVEEVLELVRNAAQAFKANSVGDEFDFVMEGKTNHLCPPLPTVSFLQNTFTSASDTPSQSVIQTIAECWTSRYWLIIAVSEESGGGKDATQARADNSVAENPAAQQQQDWSVVWEYFDNPQKLLLQPGGTFSKVMQDMVRNAVAEMRRYYSRKVVDVLIKVTRHSLDCLRKRFSPDSDITGSSL